MANKLLERSCTELCREDSNLSVTATMETCESERKKGRYGGGVLACGGEALSTRRRWGLRSDAVTVCVSGYGFRAAVLGFTRRCGSSETVVGDRRRRRMRHHRAWQWSFSGVARPLGFHGSSHLLGCLSSVAVHMLFMLSLAINLVEGWVCDDAFVSGQRNVHEDQPCRGAIDAIAVPSTST
ncbi:hypothetical protein E2542_SST08130 [Spatholobus suberectus]|nr:hypothetical protein E2542_SST08130 [Spatholobus suberectus]